MKLIVGLGNPGKEYQNTRHNVGFEIIDNYCQNEKFCNKFNGEYLEKTYNSEKIIFLKPLSYMNLSGTVVKKYVDYFKIETNEILIIHDDLDLPLGTAKLKQNSSSGGNNGMKSIIQELKTQDFCQYKIGISNNKQIDTKDYVLGKFGKEERNILEKQIELSKSVIDSFIKNGSLETMNQYNGILK